jgi:hypothetical protein
MLFALLGSVLGTPGRRGRATKPHVQEVFRGRAVVVVRAPRVPQSDSALLTPIKGHSRTLAHPKLVASRFVQELIAADGGRLRWPIRSSRKLQ